ncbi:MAG: hypothetical protein LBK95_18615, partial [Bifidobacteriaceae bacterium]|nr:hypothetical protein [Bifidobacteriaceae bacterium]
DATCDRIAIIKEGRLVSTFVADDLRHNDQKEFKVGFASADDFEGFLARAPRSGPWAVVGSRPRRNQAKVAVADQDVGELIAALADRRLEYLTEVKFTLEDHFMRFYERGAPSGEGAADAWH